MKSHVETAEISEVLDVLCEIRIQSRLKIKVEYF